MIPLTTLLAASVLLSCSTVAIGSQAPKGSNKSNGFPLSRANGSGSSSQMPGASDDDAGPTTHGLDGDRWQDRVPREPMWFINPGAGVRNSSVNPEDNARGFAHWWRGERAVDELLVRIRRGYDVGARWFFINRPMGTPGNTYVPGASWLTIDKERRERIPEMLTDALLDEFDEPVHIVWFVGSDMSDPRSYPGWTPARDDEFYQLGKEDNWEQLIGSRVTLGGWISTGASGLAIDNSSPMRKRGHYQKLFEQLSGFPFHLAVYGEAFPLVFDDRGRMQRDDAGLPLVDQEYIRSMPWLASELYIKGHWPLSIDSSTGSFDPVDTRMFVWFASRVMSYGDAESRKELVNDYMDRGLIPITYDPVMFTEALNRLRSEEQTQQSSARDSGSSSRSSNAATGPARRSSMVIKTSSRSRSTKGTQSTTKSQELPDRYRRNRPTQSQSD